VLQLAGYPRCRNFDQMASQPHVKPQAHDTSEEAEETQARTSHNKGTTLRPITERSWHPVLVIVCVTLWKRVILVIGTGLFCSATLTSASQALPQAVLPVCEEGDISAKRKRSNLRVPRGSLTWSPRVSANLEREQARYRRNRATTTIIRRGGRETDLVVETELTCRFLVLHSIP
jgi:hypothetical protein